MTAASVEDFLRHQVEEGTGWEERDLLADARPPGPRELWYVRDGAIRLRPHRGQYRALTSTRRFVWMLAGTQGGKTSLGPVWLEQEMARCGAGDYLAVTSTIPLLRLKMLPEFLRYFNILGMGTWHASDKMYEVTREDHPARGSRVIFGSATNPESLESATAKAAWLDECGQDQFRLGSWEAIQRRLSLHQGRVLGTTTPYNLGWLKQQVFDRWQHGDRTHDVIQFESVANPAFPRDEYERMRGLLPGWKFDLFYRARFARPAGLIYADFIDAYREEGGHKVHPFDLPTHWPRFVGVDPGGGVNTASVWLALDPEARVYYLYHETLEGGLTTPQHAEKALATARGVNVVSWHGGAKSEEQHRLDWTAAGVPLREPPISDVEAGIDRVIGLFKGWRLYVFDTCIRTLDELGSYSRPTDEEGNPQEGIKDKQRYHALDALRYVVLGAEGPPDTLDQLTFGGVGTGWFLGRARSSGNGGR